MRGEKTQTHDMVKQKSKSKSDDQHNVACFTLGKSDHEGWLNKKGEEEFSFTKGKYFGQ